jgi:glyoxylate utilization-related uncharacterized protein
LEGEINVTIGDQTIRGAAGSFVLIPRGTVHTFSTVGTEPAKMLVIISPAGFEQFFTEIDGVTDVEKIMTLAPRYNLAIMGPPGSWEERQEFGGNPFVRSLPVVTHSSENEWESF